MDQRSISDQLTACRRLFEDLLKQREAECEAYSNATLYEQELWSYKRAQLARLADIDHAQRRITSLDAALERASLGQYGRCSCCEASIEQHRLATDPAEPHCSACARQLDPTLRAKSVDIGVAYEALVVEVQEKIAILALPTGEHGSLSLAEIADQPLGQLNEYLKVGDVVRVKALGKDESGRVCLTMKMSRQVAA
jgi:RNA polymerase-binding transcription factor DksA